MNLIQQKYPVNSYFCTWSSQNDYCALYPQSGRSARDAMGEEFVFGENGLIHQFPEIRSSLYFLFDDGWDVPFGLANNDNGDFGSLIVNDERFPFCTGEPQERLKKLADRVASHGWKGAAIWVSASGKGETAEHLFTPEEREHYWRERLQWSRYAGIAYWKVDWGCFGNDVAFRRQLSQWKNEEYPELVMEHADVSPPVSGIEQWDQSPEQSGRFFDWGDRPQTWGKIVAFADVFRTYDVSPFLSVPTTLDRVQSMLRLGECIGSKTVLNAEDEPYICAALGLETGVMRNQLRQKDGKSVYPAPTEPIRALRWMTAFAPPFAMNVGETRFGKYILTDYSVFDGKNCWVTTYGDRNVPQGAPSLVARNCDLPYIEYPTEEKPYIVTSKNPTGAVCVSVLPRYSAEIGRHTPPAKITLNHTADQPIGVFGTVEELTVVFDSPLAGKRILAQDLAGDTAVDITEKCSLQGEKLTVNGALLREIGTLANDPDDLSDPGVVLAFI